MKQPALLESGVCPKRKVSDNGHVQDTRAACRHLLQQRHALSPYEDRSRLGDTTVLRCPPGIHYNSSRPLYPASTEPVLKKTHTHTHVCVVVGHGRTCYVLGRHLCLRVSNRHKKINKLSRHLQHTPPTGTSELADPSPHCLIRSANHITHAHLLHLVSPEPTQLLLHVLPGEEGVDSGSYGGGRRRGYSGGGGRRGGREIHYCDWRRGIPPSCRVTAVEKGHTHVSRG